MMKKFNAYFSEAFQQYQDWQQMLDSNEMLKTAVDLLKKLEQIEPNSENLIVGGAVRDLLLGHQPHDVDIATNIDIDTISKHFETADIGKSKDFGIVDVPYGDFHYEVANFRTESGYSDSRHPDKVEMVKTFEQDAKRRDLTINALGIDKNGVIHDYVGGIDDLNNKLIRTVGEPFKRFTEDSLRLLRVGRFATRLGFKIDSETEKAIMELKNTITNVAPERVKAELFKVAGISGLALADYIEHLDKVGLLALILPELHEMKHGDYPHQPKHHPEGNVFQHVLAALRTSKSKDAIINLAIMAHDLGKIATKGANEEGAVTYKGHEDAGKEIFEKIAERLKFSNDERDSVLFAIEYHMQGHRFPEMKKSKIISIRQNKNWPVLKDVLHADQAARGPDFQHKNWIKDMDYVEDIFKKFGEKETFEKKMSTFVDGRKIMELRPDVKGFQIGVIKNAAREYVIQNDFNVTPEDVKEFIKRYEIV